MTDGLFPPETFTDELGRVFIVPDGCTPDNAATCRSCGAPVLWVITRAGKRAPYTPEGLTHFADRPQGRDWSRRGKP